MGGRPICAQFRAMFQLFLHFIPFFYAQAVQKKKVISKQSGVSILPDARRQLIMKAFRGRWEDSWRCDVAEEGDPPK